MLDSFKIGHYQDDEIGTGCTVILAENGAVGGVSVRGGAPGTRETDLLKSENTVDMVNAIVLAGGSAYGLEASCGVMDFLRLQDIGYDAGDYKVPIVCSAVIYDLSYKKFGYPDKEMGFNAAKYAKSNNFAYGNIGAGTGATCGKILGMSHASKTGLGIATVCYRDVELAAIVVVNAFGDVYDYEYNTIIAGADLGEDWADTVSILTGSDSYNAQKNSNTTIGCIITNAKLTKPQANKLADTTHDALAMSIRPVHTGLDGDTIFTLASGEVECNNIVLSTLATEAMNRAIIRAVERDE